MDSYGKTGIIKAAVCTKYGPPEVLKIQEVEKPVPKDTEVLVKIYAVSVNAADYRSMRLGIIPARKIFGADIAGTIEASGKNTQKFKIGDGVFGDISGCGFGGFAEFAAVPESVLAAKPAAVFFEDAAALPMAALTALQALRDKGGIRPGQKVLIYGAGGQGVRAPESERRWYARHRNQPGSARAAVRSRARAAALCRRD